LGVAWTGAQQRLSGGPVCPKSLTTYSLMPHSHGATVPNCAKGTRKYPVMDGTGRNWSVAPISLPEKELGRISLCFLHLRKVGVKNPTLSAITTLCRM
jgi:hypothetical protein